MAELSDYDRFEWDETKRELNIQRHGIDFGRAIQIFAGQVLTVRSDRKGEVRWIATSKFEERIISVVFTQRGSVRRIISARAARSKERAAYRALYP